jgi:hypothetical protein
VDLDDPDAPEAAALDDPDDPEDSGNDATVANFTMPPFAPVAAE